MYEGAFKKRYYVLLEAVVVVVVLRKLASVLFVLHHAYVRAAAACCTGSSDPSAFASACSFFPYTQLIRLGSFKVVVAWLGLAWFGRTRNPELVKRLEGRDE